VKLRLLGVDTPETVHPSKPVEAFGKEARRFTSNLLKGESVYLEFDKDKTDKYGRTLAFVYRAPDGLFVNLEIVRQGYGHAYTKYPFDPDMKKLFRHYEKDAREAGAGRGAVRTRLTARTQGAEVGSEGHREGRGVPDGERDQVPRRRVQVPREVQDPRHARRREGQEARAAFRL
jgi:micrococcal nuclease